MSFQYIVENKNMFFKALNKRKIFIDIPKLLKIKQNFKNDNIKNIEKIVRKQILELNLQIKNNSKIAIAVGSRGINNIASIVKETVRCIKEMDCHPFIVPAMGSHGGATARGQKEILESYRINEESTGAPVISSMQVENISSNDLPFPIYMDRNAYKADGIILINRIKVHSDFHGKTESGLLKMCVIGLGKHKQALEMHKYGVYGLREMIPAAARYILKSCNILFGIGIVENAYDKTALIKAIKPCDIEREEINMFKISKSYMTHFPIDELDLLIIDKMGKDISGVGMDPNIIGRIRIPGESEPSNPKIKNIVVTDLTEASHGNALGMGLADFITERLHSKIDFKATYENAITSTFLERGKMPIIAINDRAAIEYALRTCGPINISNARIIRIKNTLNLYEMYVSSTIWNKIKDKSNIEKSGDFLDITQINGDLIKF